MLRAHAHTDVHRHLADPVIQAEQLEDVAPCGYIVNVGYFPAGQPGPPFLPSAQAIAFSSITR
jgi:hypothetical protein